MSHLAATDELFFNRAGLDRARLEAQVDAALKGADDGELFLEYRQTESLGYDDGRLKTANFDTMQGFGLRSVAGDAAGYAHASELSEAAIKRAADTVSAVQRGHQGEMAEAPLGTNTRLYGDDNPLALVPFETKVKLLEQIDAYARGKDSRVQQVTRLGQRPMAGRADHPGRRSAGRRRAAPGASQESGSYGGGGRITYESLFEPSYWQAAVDEALRQALVNLGSVDAPAGEMEVVLGPGWPGVLLHEAVGHGLEGDFNRKKTSAFAGLMGERVASPGVTVVDDGTIADRRGSLTIDDEGTPTSTPP